MSWSISKKTGRKASLVILLLAMLVFAPHMPMAFWDFLFLSGLVFFMLGGAALLVEKGVFDRFVASFRTLLKSTSKVEAYAAEMELRSPAQHRADRKIPLTRLLLGFGIIIIATSTVFPLYLF